MVADEIHSYLESPDELIFEQVEELVFARNPLGRTILGTEETLRRFTREDILAFLRRCFSPQRMLICFSGDVPPERVREEAEKYLARYPQIFSRPILALGRKTPAEYHPLRQEKEMEIEALVKERRKFYRYKSGVPSNSGFYRPASRTPAYCKAVPGDRRPFY